MGYGTGTGEPPWDAGQYFLAEWPSPQADRRYVLLRPKGSGGYVRLEQILNPDTSRGRYAREWTYYPDSVSIYVVELYYNEILEEWRIFTVLWVVSAVSGRYVTGIKNPGDLWDAEWERLEDRSNPPRNLERFRMWTCLQDLLGRPVEAFDQHERTIFATSPEDEFRVELRPYMAPLTPIYEIADTEIYRLLGADSPYLLVHDDFKAWLSEMGVDS